MRRENYPFVLGGGLTAAVAVLAFFCAPPKHKRPEATAVYDVVCPDGKHTCEHGFICTPDNVHCTHNVFYCPGTEKTRWCYDGLVCTPDNQHCVRQLAWCHDGNHWCYGGQTCSADSQHCLNPDDGYDPTLVPAVMGNGPL